MYNKSILRFTNIFEITDKIQINIVTYNQYFHIKHPYRD